MMSVQHNQAITRTILSIQVGMPTTHEQDPLSKNAHSAWTSGIFKYGVSGPVELTEHGFAGDGQANLKVHGGPDRAVLLFSATNYPAIEAHLNRSIPRGGFGENLTVDHFDESDVCLGDVWQCGPCQVEISQPRLPCANLARRLEAPDIVSVLIKARKGGSYARVVKPGFVSAGDPLQLIERPYPKWTIQRAFACWMEDTDFEELEQIPPLSQLWRDGIRDYFAKKD